MDINKPVHINSMNFEKVIRKGIVLVDFWAPWCSPCRAMEPVLDDLASHLEGKGLITKINVDENPSISSRYGIFSIPTMIIFHDGKEFRRFTGGQSSEKLQKIITDQYNNTI